MTTYAETKGENIKTGIKLIAQERQRQIEKEGWTPQHDDTTHSDKSIAQAAACYLLDYTQKYNLGRAWPWSNEAWKPTPNDPVRQLVKAGALIAAEIDRLNRNFPYFFANHPDLPFLMRCGGSKITKGKDSSGNGSVVKSH